MLNLEGPHIEKDALMDYGIDKILTDYSLTECREFNPELISIDKAVREMCRQNRCGQYGKNYTCPPHTKEIDAWSKEICSFSHGIIFTKAYPREDSFDIESIMEGGMAFNKTVIKMREDLIHIFQDKKILFLGAGPCVVCKRCACLDNEPCRFPDRAVTSVEACGIEVIRLCRDLGVRYNNGEKSVTYIGLILNTNKKGDVLK